LKSVIRACLAAATIAIAAPMVHDAAAHEDEIRTKVPALVTEHITIPSDTPGIQLYIRNKHPQGVAVRDVGAAVDFILKRRGLKKLNLMGWSWGTSTMATYTTQNNDKVNKLVLYAPLWLRNTPSLTGSDGPLGAYRTVVREAAKKRWLTGVPEDKQADLIPAGWFDAWADATWDTDPKSKESGQLRAPNGIIQDLRTYWMAGKPYYDPANIRVPTLLIKAEWDQDTPAYMSQALFPLLKNAPAKRYVEIGEGTHTVIMEKNRLQLFREVQLFLDEAAK
jgi:pimeloyl-ACP methyl ester carboxylesterase